MSDKDGTIEAWLADNPRLVGVLFAALLALSQAGSAMASAGSSWPGP